VAVLPLTDLAGDTTQAYLVAGVHEALIAELGRLRLPVIARATMATEHQTVDPAASALLYSLASA